MTVLASTATTRRSTIAPGASTSLELDRQGSNWTLSLTTSPVPPGFEACVGPVPEPHQFCVASTIEAPRLRTPKAVWPAMFDWWIEGAPASTSRPSSLPVRCVSSKAVSPLATRSPVRQDVKRLLDSVAARSWTVSAPYAPPPKGPLLAPPQPTVWSAPPYRKVQPSTLDESRACLVSTTPPQYVPAGSVAPSPVESPATESSRLDVKVLPVATSPPWASGSEGLPTTT